MTEYAAPSDLVRIHDYDHLALRSWGDVKESSAEVATVDLNIGRAENEGRSPRAVMCLTMSEIKPMDLNLLRRIKIL